MISVIFGNCQLLGFYLLSRFESFSECSVYILATLQSLLMYLILLEIPSFLLMETKTFTLQKWKKKSLTCKILRKTKNNSKIQDKDMKAGYNKSQWDVIQCRPLWSHAWLKLIQFAVRSSFRPLLAYGRCSLARFPFWWSWMVSNTACLLLILWFYISVFALHGYSSKKAIWML